MEYRCTTTWRRCNGKHNNSICDKLSNQLMLAIGEGRAQYPVVVVEVDGIRCSALLNIEAGSSDASAVLISKLNRKPAGKLPTDWTEGSRPFQVVGPDFAGPTGYKVTIKKEGKTYRKIPKISPTAYIFQSPFLRGLYSEGLIFGGAI